MKTIYEACQEARESIQLWRELRLKIEAMNSIKAVHYDRIQSERDSFKNVNLTRMDKKDRLEAAMNAAAERWQNVEAQAARGLFRLLDPAHYRVGRAYYLEGQEPHEIAQIQNLSLKAVKKSLTEIKKQLKQEHDFRKKTALDYAAGLTDPETVKAFRDYVNCSQDTLAE